MIDARIPSALLLPAQMAEADRRAVAAGVTGLMDAAGWAVARAARRFGPCRTLVLCGPGNNGGDGYVAARLLAGQGWPVSVAALAPPRTDDARRAAMRWHGPVAPFVPEEARRADLVIDSVFGAGLARPLDPIAVATLGAARQVLAVDVPSGLDGATGQPWGDVRGAAATVTFCRLKPGHLLLPGRHLCGELILRPIGMPDDVLAAVRPAIFRNGPALWSVPAPAVDGHKYSRGHVTILGGAEMTGAARLAAAASRHGGAGMVSIAARDGGDLYRAGAPGVIVTGQTLAALLEDERRRVWVCGPGLGAGPARENLPVLLAARRMVVADADSFTAFAGRPDELRGCAVITPHAGEFARVFGDPGPDRVDAARRAAERIAGVVVLKGADTIVAAPDGRVAINASAPPWLGTAGSGDVLAGLIAALLAAGMDAWPAAAAAVWLHGRAGALAGPGLIAEDLPPAIGQAIAETWSVTCGRVPAAVNAPSHGPSGSVRAWWNWQTRQI